MDEQTNKREEADKQRKNREEIKEQRNKGEDAIRETNTQKEADGFVDSVYCGSGVDGAGLRCVVFFSGCNLRCPFCHNPETLYNKGERYTAEALFEKLRRYKPYFKRGGVTLSGGEPFLQKTFLLALVALLKAEGIHVIAETNGHICDREILASLDGVVVDIKNQESDDLAVYDSFFAACKEVGCKAEATNVLVPDKNDAKEKLIALASLAKRWGVGLRFLPFRKLCEQKYEELALEFPYGSFREAEDEDVKKAEKALSNR